MRRDFYFKISKKHKIFDTLIAIIKRADADRGKILGVRNNSHASLGNPNSNLSSIAALLEKTQKKFRTDQDNSKILKDATAIEVLSIEILNFSILQEPIFLKGHIADPPGGILNAVQFVDFLLQRMFECQDPYVRGLYSELFNNLLVIQYGLDESYGGGNMSYSMPGVDRWNEMLEQYTKKIVGIFLDYQFFRIGNFFYWRVITY